MSLKTRSSFLYGITVNSSNHNIDFIEDNVTRSAKLNTGNYTLDSLARELERVMRYTGVGDYTCTVDRLNRSITINSSLPVKLLADGNHSASNCMNLIGFSDTTNLSTTHTSDRPIGVLYIPQFPLQEYLAPENCKSAIFESINESAKAIEIVSIGEKQQCEFSIKYITDKVMGHVIENNSNAVAEVREFLNYLRSKGVFDFMPDRDNPNFFYSMFMEKNSFSSNGTGYKLYEMKDVGLPDFYETKLITCRVLL